MCALAASCKVSRADPSSVTIFLFVTPIPCPPNVIQIRVKNCDLATPLVTFTIRPSKSAAEPFDLSKLFGNRNLSVTREVPCAGAAPCDFERVGEPRPKEVPLVDAEHLRLALRGAEHRGRDDLCANFEMWTVAARVDSGTRRTASAAWERGMVSMLPRWSTTHFPKGMDRMSAYHVRLTASFCRTTKASYL